MLTGITYFEKIVPPKDGEKHLENLAKQGFKHIEFSPHPTLISSKDLKNFVKKGTGLGMTTAFHNPDFADAYNFSLNFFKSNPQMRDNLIKLFHRLCEINPSSEFIKFVVHGASATPNERPDREFLIDLNDRAFDYLSNEILRQSLPIQLHLENTCYLDEYAVTQTAEDLSLFFQKYQGAPIALCLDLPHWFRQCKGQGEAPDKIFETSFKNIIDQTHYAHLHGISKNLEKSHLPLEIENSFYFDFVKAFYSNKKEIIFNLEIFDLQGIENFSTFESVVTSSFQLLVENCR